MLFLLIFLFFQVQQAAQNIIPELFLNSPVEDMTPFKYKSIKLSSTALLLPLVSAFYFSCFQITKTEKILKNKFFLSGFGICTVGGLIGMKKIYDLNQYVFNSYDLILYIYMLKDKKTNKGLFCVRGEDVIESLVKNQQIKDFLIFCLRKDKKEEFYYDEKKIKESFEKTKNFFNKKNSNINLLINNLKQLVESDEKLEE